MFFSINSKSQKLKIVPRIGIQYFGLSHISKSDHHPEDFKTSLPELGGILGVDILYKSKKYTHNLCFQSTELGNSLGVRNLYANKGIIPYFQQHRSSDAINVFLLAYNLQKESRKVSKLIGKSTFKLFYSAGVGVSFNKTHNFYDKIFSKPHTYGFIDGDHYYNDTVQTYRGGTGFFLIGKAGMNFYTKRRKHILSLEVFWNQGLRKMQEFSIDYDYGYFSYSQYQRTVKDVTLKSNGTVFGFTLGVPIRLF